MRPLEVVTAPCEPEQQRHRVIRFLNISFVTVDTNHRKWKGVLCLRSSKEQCCKNIAGAKTTEIDYGAPNEINKKKSRNAVFKNDRS
jgi:hypothetical protein